MAQKSATTATNNVLYTQLSAQSWQSRFNALPASLRQRVSRFIQPADRDARIAGYWLLEKLVVAFGLGRDTLSRIAYTGFGRPYLPGESLDFNLSHSGDWVVCAVTSVGRIGVDVERIRPINFDDCATLFEPTVWRHIVESCLIESSFYRMWTRMEAVAKADGRGVMGPVTTIRYEMDGAWFGDSFWHLLEVPIEACYSCHIAADRRVALDAVARI